MQCGTTSAYTSVLCEWREEKELCGQWMKQSIRGGKDKSITGKFSDESSAIYGQIFVSGTWTV